MTIWLLPLFFIAIALGFFLGGQETKRRQKKQLSRLTQDYSQSINYLLNEQPDRAVSALLSSLSVTEYTLETHLALGKLFRRKGEFDRAISIHENLLASDKLKLEDSIEVMFELGLDYFTAGVFDRAEQFFSDVAEKKNKFSVRAMRHLLRIYEQEKDWHSALAVGIKLMQQDVDMAPTLAHYFCELADLMIKEDALKPANRSLKRALRLDKRCTRAWLMRARLEQQLGDQRSALSSYLSLSSFDTPLFDSILAEVEAVYCSLKGEGDWLRFLADACITEPSTRRVLRLARGLEDYYGEHEAAKLLSAYLQDNPSVAALYRYIDLTLEKDNSAIRPSIDRLKEMTQKHPDSRYYRCTSCGFGTSQIYWQCPSCKQWGCIHITSDDALVGSSN